MVRISIITPSYQQGRFIERTIKSVIVQTQPPEEFVIVDANSTDETAAIIAGYADRLRLVREPDRGQADAVNKGIRLTSGDVIGWLNSDDVYLPGALDTIAAAFAAAPEADVIYGDAQLIDEHDLSLGAYYTEPWNARRLAERCFICQPAVFFRRRVVERYGLLDATLQYALDYEYWLRLAEGGAIFRYLATPLAAARLHPQAKTLRARRAVHDEINGVLRRRVGRVPESWLINEAHTVVELGGPHTVPFSLLVVVQVLRLSLRWNRSVSRRLVGEVLSPIVAGGKRRLGRVRRPFSLARR